MSLPLNINGVVYDYPEQGDTNWGLNATDWAQAVSTSFTDIPFVAESDTNGAFNGTSGVAPVTQLKYRQFLVSPRPQVPALVLTDLQLRR